MGDESIVLTDREREALAGLAESIGDPWLARQLSGGEPPPPPKRPLAGLAAAVLRATAGRVGVLLVVAGAVLAVMTFARSIGLAAVGLAMMGFGTWRIAAERGDDLILRWKTARQARQARPVRASRPQPPRTPPAAE